LNLKDIQALIAAAFARLAKPKPAPKPPAPQFDWNDEFRRLNYYADSDFAAYQAALAARQPGPDGIKPFVDPADYKTPCPTPGQWATLTPAQRGAPGSVRF